MGLKQVHDCRIVLVIRRACPLLGDNSNLYLCCFRAEYLPTTWWTADSRHLARQVVFLGLVACGLRELNEPQLLRHLAWWRRRRKKKKKKKNRVGAEKEAEYICWTGTCLQLVPKPNIKNGSAIRWLRTVTIKVWRGWWVTDNRGCVKPIRQRSAHLRKFKSL